MRHKTVILALIFASGVLACAQEYEVRTEILQALAARSRVGPVGPEQISFSGAPKQKQALTVSTLRFDPMLHSWTASLRCVPSPKCLPFLVTINTDDPAAFSNPVSTSRHLPLVHQSERKLMISETGPVRISEPVTCLQNGRANQVIRVRTLATGQIRRALVSEEGRLLATKR